jgi:agmatine deiminase
MPNAPAAEPFRYGKRRFPAEWETQEAIWFAWPTRDDLWAGFQQAVRRDLAALYVTASRYQTVRVLCPSAAQSELKAYLKSSGWDGQRIELFDYQTDDVWCRDFGPIFVQTEAGALLVTSWEYNAWGGKFALYQRDNAVPEWIAEQLGLDCLEFDIVAEGGAIESNGAGSLLTTECVLLNANRGQQQSDARARIEDRFSRAFGLQQILWLGDGLAGDDTDGHIDNLARFFAEDGILYATTDPSDSANFAALEANRVRLESFRTPTGKPFRTIPLPLPPAVFADGERLAASYLNFLILNGAVLVPTYGDPAADDHACHVLSECFPGRKIERIDSRVILREGGSLHCLSQPQPLASDSLIIL